MKKQLVVIVLSLCLAISFAVPVGAVATGKYITGSLENNDVVSCVLENEALMKELKNEAPNTDLISAKNVAACGKDFVTFEEDTLLSTFVDGDVTIKEYQKNVASVYYIEPDAEISPVPGTVAPTANGSISDNKVDSTGSYRIYSTINYTTSTSAPSGEGAQMVKLTKVSGYYTRLANGVSVSKQAVRMGQTGLAVGGHVEQVKDFAPATSSWSYTPPSTWKAVNVDMIHDVGVDYEVTLARTGGSTWSVVLTNNYP